MPPRIVLDTNATLDWLLFRDPSASFGAAIAAGRLHWCASPAMRQEFEQVLGRPALAGWGPDAAAAGAAWDRHATLDASDPPPGPLQCRDPDDQVFIDLALHRRCAWLLTRDRALLALAKRAQPWGVAILSPAVWAKQNPMLALTDVQRQT